MQMKASKGRYTHVNNTVWMRGRRWQTEASINLQRQVSEEPRGRSWQEEAGADARR